VAILSGKTEECGIELGISLDTVLAGSDSTLIIGRPNWELVAGPLGGKTIAPPFSFYVFY